MMSGKAIAAAKLTVVSRRSNDAIQADDSKLLPRLQNSTLKIQSGQTLLLHCASLENKVSSLFEHTLHRRLMIHLISLTQISWSFTPRMDGSTPIDLRNSNNELKIVKASAEKHDGIYNCSTDTDFQVS